MILCDAHDMNLPRDLATMQNDLQRNKMCQSSDLISLLSSFL